jgi:hypothetical protein
VCILSDEYLIALARTWFGRVEALYCIAFLRTCCDIDTAEEEGVESVDISTGRDIIAPNSRKRMGIM